MKCDKHNVFLEPVIPGSSAVHCPLCVMTTIDVDEAAWQKIKQAAKDSPWIPKEYFLNDWVSDVCRFLKTYHDHSCGCGTSESDHGHEVGHIGCVRRMTDAPTPMEHGQWLVGGSLITDFTLRQQRGYYQHPCGCWSKSPGSINSLEGDW
jgi:hypothetical protein